MLPLTLLALLFDALKLKLPLLLTLLLQTTTGGLKDGWTTLRLIASAADSQGAKAEAREIE